MPTRHFSHSKRLSQTAGLAFGLEQAEDVVLADCAILVSLVIGGEGGDVAYQRP